MLYFLGMTTSTAAATSTLEMIATLAALQSPSPSWLWDTAGSVLVGQAVVGLIGLVGLIAVVRRFMSTDFPAAMKGVHDRLDTLHRDFESLEREFRTSILDLERVKERQDAMRSRIDSIERRERDNLEDTRTGRRYSDPPRQS